MSKGKKNKSEFVNPYLFIDQFSKTLPKDITTVVSNGSASVVGSATYYIGKDQRFIMNCGISSMGYGLPASIGACVASNNKKTVCIEGDGSIMMNIQELQTIATNKLPIKIVILNNDGYQQIRLTQTNVFDKRFVGLGPDSNDLGFPSFEKIAYAFDIPYFKCNANNTIEEIEKFLKDDNYAILEVMCDKDQIFEPKSATKKLDDGTLYSPPLEDLSPFLNKDELKENMYIKLWRDEDEKV